MGHRINEWMSRSMAPACVIAGTVMLHLDLAFGGFWQFSFPFLGCSRL
jgi:uncharacterized membrane protein